MPGQAVYHAGVNDAVRTGRLPRHHRPLDRIDREKRCAYSWHMSRYDLIENALALPAAERLEIIAALWDSIDGAHTPLTPAQAAELDRRLASFEADKADVMTWEEFKAELEERAR